MSTETTLAPKACVSKGFLPTRRPALVLKKTLLDDRVYSVVLRDHHMATHAMAGQFANLYVPDPSRVLPRPLGIASIDADNDAAEFIFAVVGEGTHQLSQVNVGESIDVLGPLGKGFLLRENTHYLLVGGGLGVPPLIAAAQRIREAEGARATAVFGYRKNHFADESVSRYAHETLSIDESEGNVVDLLNRWEQETRAKGESTDVEILSCGPHAMMQAVAAWAGERGIDSQLSLEERMGCGYGTCVVCVTPTVDGLKKVCFDGPIFTAQQLGW